MNNSLLEIKNLTYKKNLRTILNDINLNVGYGKIVALLGENGAGKTTLIRIISGIAKNYRGNVAVNGQQDEEARKSQVSITDALKGFNESTKIDEIEFFYEKIYPDFDDHQFKELREFMKLSGDMKLRQLSKGMREKLEIALTLSRKVPLYLLDEPFSGIDPLARKRIINSILLWKDPKATMIISDHFVNEITTILDEVIVVKDKTIASHIAADDIRANGQSIEQYYESMYEDGGAE
ncbi:ABC transporter ATP-binding protein [uncultured Lactobacillus sp.]|uniref:ATP-binding cassette domain-containing protein n=1 Tax=uncultured Lactobacillus sp. TaxID=153152 RepID=UPI002619A0D5|nr:ABC transporter ATP-binding protein [uncultured Lactobacillus sp.]